jgi:hypothetical protein
MIEQIYYINANTQRRWTFNTNTCPLKTFETDQELRQTDRPKMQEGGSWRSYNYIGPQIIHLSGDLIGDTVEEYIDRRLDFLQVLAPPVGRQKLRYWGTLYLKYYGQSIFHNAVTMEGYPDLDIGINPTVSPYTVSFRAFNPYWTKSAGGAQVLI